MAMKTYKERKSIEKEYKVFSPLVILFSDGKLCPGLNATNDDIERCYSDYNKACESIKSYEHNSYADELTFIAVALKGTVGNAEIDELRKLSSHNDRVVEITDTKSLYSLFQSCVYFTVHNTFPSDDYKQLEF